MLWQKANIQVHYMLGKMRCSSWPSRFEMPYIKWMTSQALLSVAGNIFAFDWPILHIVEELLSHCYRRANVTLEQIEVHPTWYLSCDKYKKCRKQNLVLYATFVDLTKAFDTVSRNGLWRNLSKLGCHQVSLHSLAATYWTKTPDYTQWWPIWSLPHRK